jgi:prepilin-type N-terminal cleavage/methylation domain-containing protein/prepilin-type processing-associated H-X9-DG protein
MGTPRMARRPLRIGFTLVELLVVIGIIALLISILLPSLARARGSAVLIDCQARLRSIGQGMHVYAAQYKGVLPGGTNWFLDGTTWRSRPAATMISQVLGSPEWDINPMFHDKETIEPAGGAGSSVGDNPYSRLVGPFTSHYTPNSRLFPWALKPGSSTLDLGDRYDGTPNGIAFGPSQKKQTAFRNLGSIKKSAETAAWWDAAQVRDFGGSGARRMWAAYPYSDGTGDWTWHTATRGRFVSIDNANTGYDGTVTVFSDNLDPTALAATGQSQGGIRFRHMKDTTAAILYADGHVGSHTYNKATGKTSMPLSELGTNWVPPTTIP